MALVTEGPRLVGLISGRNVVMSGQKEAPAHTDAAQQPHDPTMRDAESLTVDEVRGGETGTGLRYVLIFSMAAAVIALAIVFFNFVE